MKDALKAKFFKGPLPAQSPLSLGGPLARPTVLWVSLLRLSLSHCFVKHTGHNQVLGP